MRWVVVAALAACGTTPGATPVGTVTVTVYSDAFHSTDFVTEGKPLAGETVFEDGGQAITTDANGEATLAVTHDPATVHVASNATALVTTIAAVPVGGHAWIGNRPYFMSVGITEVTLQDIGATSYDVAAPSCMSRGATNGNRVAFTLTSACAGMTERLVGVAVTPTGTKVVEQDVAVTSNMPVMLGAFTDATVYAPTTTNVPAFPSAPLVTIGVVGPQGMAITLPTLAGPADANRVVLSTGDASAASRLVIDGPIGATVDASHMLPVPDLGNVDAHGAAWSIAASGAQPNLVEVQVVFGSLAWRVYAPPSSTHVAFPRLPKTVATAAPSGDPTAVVLNYFELPRAALTLDELAGSFDGLTAPLRADHQPIAASQRSL